MAIVVSGCSSTIAAHRPLSEESLSRVNEAVEDRRAIVELVETPESREAAKQRAERDELARQTACRAAPGRGVVPFAGDCVFTLECECGLTCEVGTCLGTSLKWPKDQAGGDRREATEVRVGKDVTQWLELQPGTDGRQRPATAPTDALKQIMVNERGTGALVGLGLGLLSGGLVGALVISSGQNDQVPIVKTIEGLALIPLIALSGAIVGAGVGHRTTIEFDSVPQPPKPPVVEPPSDPNGINR
jgi:hypothetical protein